MKYRVHIISDAEEDIFEIYEYVARNDSPSRAGKLLDKIEECCYSLSGHPRRGHIPPELKRIDVYEFLEIHYKPYRIIYQIISNNVYIHCILDGRRDLDDLLREQLLR